MVVLAHAPVLVTTWHSGQSLVALVHSLIPDVCDWSQKPLTHSVPVEQVCPAAVLQPCPLTHCWVAEQVAPPLHWQTPALH